MRVSKCISPWAASCGNECSKKFINSVSQIRKWVSLPFPWLHLPCSLFYLTLSIVIPTERLTWRHRAEKQYGILLVLCSLSFLKIVSKPLSSVILDIPSGAELRFNCEICIVTQQINSAVSHRPFTAEGHFGYKSLISRSQLHQHFIPPRKVIRGEKYPVDAELVFGFYVSV